MLQRRRHRRLPDAVVRLPAQGASATGCTGTRVTAIATVAQDKRVSARDEIQNELRSQSPVPDVQEATPPALERMPFSLPPTPPPFALPPSHAFPGEQASPICPTQPIPETPPLTQFTPRRAVPNLRVPVIKLLPMQASRTTDPRDEIHRQFAEEIKSLQAHTAQIKKMSIPVVRKYIYSLQCCIEDIRSLVAVSGGDQSAPDSPRVDAAKQEADSSAARGAAGEAIEEPYLSAESSEEDDTEQPDPLMERVLALVTEVGKTNRRHGMFYKPTRDMTDAEWVLITTWKGRFSRDARKRLASHTAEQKERDARLAGSVYAMISSWKPMHEVDFDGARIDEAIKFKFDGDNPPQAPEPYDEEDAFDDTDDGGNDT